VSVLVDVATVALATAAMLEFASAADDGELLATFVGFCANNGAAMSERDTMIDFFMGPACGGAAWTKFSIETERCDSRSRRRVWILSIPVSPLTLR